METKFASLNDMQEIINKILLKLISAGSATVSKKVQKKKNNKIKGDNKLAKKRSRFLLYIVTLVLLMCSSFII